MDEASRHAATGVSPSGDEPIRPAVGGDLLDALDTALEAVWDDDALVEAFCRDEGLVEVLRSAL